MYVFLIHSHPSSPPSRKPLFPSLPLHSPFHSIFTLITHSSLLYHHELTQPTTVRPRTPLHILPLPRRSRPPALHRRNLHRHNPPPLPNLNLINFPLFINHSSFRPVHNPLGPQNRRRLPRNKGAQAPRQGRDRSVPRSGPR